MTTTPGAPPAPPTDPSLVPRRLTRLTDQSKVAGVAAGIGWYLNVDPTLIRVGFVVLGLGTGGAAIGLYLLLWVVMPATTSSATMLSSPQPTDARSRRRTIVAIIVGVLIFTQFDLFRADVLIASGLIGVGVLLFVDPRRQIVRVTPPPPLPGQPPTMRTGSVPPPPTTAYTHPYAASWPTPAAPPPLARPHHEKRPRSILGPLTWAVWLLTLGVATLLSRAELITLSAGDVVGLTVAVVGAGLLVGTFVGRSRGLIVIGLLGLASLSLLSWVDGVALNLDLSGGVGEQVHTPQQVSDLQPQYSWLAGEMVLDLRELDLNGQDVDLGVDVGLGELRVLLPPGVAVDIDGTLNAGQYSILGQTDEGTGLSFSVDQESGSRGPDQGSITLDIDNTFGEITVTQEGSR